MSEANPNTALFGETLLEMIRQAVREEIEKAFETFHGDSQVRLDLLTVDELAEALKVPSSWVYDRTRRKKDPIPHVRVGRYPRFDLALVLAWLEARRKG